ncbi:hemolysin family protein [Populibacterium corticicola]|uniref:Hemolysin family protein n=1 Tax=Populibacterium corticicola TaxID=1812826 RepID=A0ABW5XAT2_9MICO
MNLFSDAPVGALIVCAILGIALAALLSAGEVAVVGVSRAALAEASAKKPERSRRLALLAENRAQVAAISSFARMVAEMFATACITVTYAAFFDEWWLVVLLSVLSSVVVALLLVRISPRTLGRHNPAGVLSALSLLLLVVYRTLRWIGPLTRAARIPTEVETEHQLRQFVERVEDSSIIEQEERDMLRSVIELHDTRVSEVMVPRIDMITIEAATPLAKAQNLFVRSGFSRVPVVGESTDEVVGVLFFKDAARVLLNSSDPDSKTVADVMRPIRFYPETKPADDLLREMQATHQHIAMAVDEYGGVAGLITIEDILEEIVGEMVDEHDTEAPSIEDLGDGVYRVPARLSLDGLGELFDIELDDPDVDTVAGLLAKALGKVPLAGASAEVEHLRISADQFAGRRKQLISVLVEKQRTHISDEPGQSGELVTQPAGQYPSDQRGSGRAEKDA